MTTTASNRSTALHTLARSLGVLTEYTDGLGQHVDVSAETLLRVCSALGVPLERPEDASRMSHRAQAGQLEGQLPPVMVAWDGVLGTIGRPSSRLGNALVHLADGETVPMIPGGDGFRPAKVLPLGYHRLVAETTGGGEAACTVISAPVQAWRRPGTHKSWGVGTHLAALRSARSRSVGDLRDLAAVARWVRAQGGDLVTALPLLPTFNSSPAEPSPYSPVSRLFWSELMLDLEDAHRPTPSPALLDVTLADAEVRAALASAPLPSSSEIDEELARYARFRGAQARLGRNWRDWPTDAKAGNLRAEHVDASVERFHLIAQTRLRRQLHDLRDSLRGDGMRIGLDLAVGVHPDGYDPWSRQHLFVEGMSVGAPPDLGFPSGQDWGFRPVLPTASRNEGHQYLAGSIAHQASFAGVLRVDHIMAWTRLYWIPHGMGLHEGTYVSYPAEELFAILTLESNLHQCEVVGENLGTVPQEIDEALPRHRIWGMYLAEFQGGPSPLVPPTEEEMGLVGTHDTPTFAGWLRGNDIAERVQYRLLDESRAPAVIDERLQTIEWLAEQLGSNVQEPGPFLVALLEWLSRSSSPLVVPWIEDLWLEEHAVNLPGTPSSVRPNWQRPMRRLLDQVFDDAQIRELLRRLDEARTQGGRAARG
jgi:4-alpha-glucanotransferase